MPKSNAELIVNVTFRHTDSTEALKKYATDKLTQCARKYLKYPAEMTVVLSVEKRDHIAEVSLHSKGLDSMAKAISDDLYAAIDKLADTVDAQLRKQKEKMITQKQSSAVV